MDNFHIYPGGKSLAGYGSVCIYIIATIYEIIWTYKNHQTSHPRRGGPCPIWIRLKNHSIWRSSAWSVSKSCFKTPKIWRQPIQEFRFFSWIQHDGRWMCYGDMEIVTKVYWSSAEQAWRFLFRSGSLVVSPGVTTCKKIRPCILFCDIHGFRIIKHQRMQG